MPKVAALYVQKDGPYFHLTDVEPWDESKDAREYQGPYPVVAHPPCQRWGKLWAGNPSVISKTGKRKVKGDDGGCFKAALASVRAYGGVLEHPWGSHAWEHFSLAKPPRLGGWVKADSVGWTCCVEQGRYGHYAPKPTLLYSVGCTLPELDWGQTKVKREDFPPEALAKYGEKKCRRRGLIGFKGGGKNSTPRIATPSAFKEVLLEMARSAKP